MNFYVTCSFDYVKFSKHMIIPPVVSFLLISKISLNLTSSSVKYLCKLYNCILLLTLGRMYQVFPHKRDTGFRHRVWQTSKWMHMVCGVKHHAHSCGDRSRKFAPRTEVRFLPPQLCSIALRQSLTNWSLQFGSAGVIGTCSHVVSWGSSTCRLLYPSHEPLRDHQESELICKSKKEPLLQARAWTLSIPKQRLDQWASSWAETVFWGSKRRGVGEFQIQMGVQRPLGRSEVTEVLSDSDWSWHCCKKIDNLYPIYVSCS